MPASQLHYAHAHTYTCKQAQETYPHTHANVGMHKHIRANVGMHEHIHAHAHVYNVLPVLQLGYRNVV